MGPRLEILAVAAAAASLPGCNGDSGTTASGQPGGTPAPAAGSRVIFRDVAQERGVEFRHFTGFTGKRYIVEIMGSGAGFIDHDQDGDFDLYLLNGAPLPGTPEPGIPPRNRFFRNDGFGSFTDATDTARTGDEGYGMGMAVGDVENDGDPDLFVGNYGADLLFRNRGDGVFEEAGPAAGIDIPGWSTSATFFDFDLDGDLDLYVAGYVDFDPATFTPCRRSGVEVYCGPQAYGGLCDRLLSNDGTGSFADVSGELGITDCSGKGLGVVAGDFEGDGDSDLYVANDGTANFLYINQLEETGSPGFTEEAIYYGVAFGYDAVAEAGMGTDMGDYDGDLDLDITVTNLEAQTNSLYRNDGGNAAMEVSYGSGLGASTLAYVGFGTCFLDFDLDSDLDLVVANGHVIDNIALVKEGSSFEQDDLLFENTGGSFREILASRDGDRLPRRAGRGLAAADIDGDGDDDVVVNNNGAQALLLENAAGQGNPSFGLLLEGSPPESNRDAYGARVLIEAGGRRLLREVHAGSSYLASQDPRLRTGLPGKGTARATIRWPGGRVEEVQGLAAGAYHLVREGEGIVESTPFRR